MLDLVLLAGLVRECSPSAPHEQTSSHAWSPLWFRHLQVLAVYSSRLSGRHHLLAFLLLLSLAGSVSYFGKLMLRCLKGLVRLNQFLDVLFCREVCSGTTVSRSQMDVFTLREWTSLWVISTISIDRVSHVYYYYCCSYKIA